ncbi:MAG: DNA adenine methylase [Clostridiales bacterium]|nr:DNA adenine methylase [Clostridiales bacterium]
MMAKPFVKWAGGKGQILTDICNSYPPELGTTINRYCEPFVGGGAVLFDILSNHDVKEVLINDINAELINTYKRIKDSPDALITALESIQEEYLSLDTAARKEYYYAKREHFNHLKINGDTATNIEKAALFIFLNRTCFNGLYRVNRSGLFNVPSGTYKNPLICDVKNLKKINVLLQKVTIKCGDYKECLDFANQNAFYYIDPPYRPLTETASFTSYAEGGFADKEQAELKEFVDELTKKGAKVLVSNSDPKNSDENDEFFDKLYSEYRIARVTAKRMINCNGDRRGSVSELMISNFGRA